MDLRARIKLEQLKLEYDHAERLIKNMLWFASLVILIILTGVVVGQLKFQDALLIIAIFGIIISIILIPIARRTDEITRMEMPALIRRRK